MDSDLSGGYCYPAGPEVSVSSKFFSLDWVHGIFVMELILTFKLLYSMTLSETVSVTLPPHLLALLGNSFS